MLAQSAAYDTSRKSSSYSHCGAGWAGWSSSVLDDGGWLSCAASNPRTRFGGATGERVESVWDPVPQYEEKRGPLCISAMVGAVLD